MRESILTWNIPNFVTIALMVGIIWIVVGVASHFFRKSSSKTTAPQAASGNLAGNGNLGGGSPSNILTFRAS